MKQKRTKPRPIAKKDVRHPPATSELYRKYIEDLEHGEYRDYVADCEERERKKSDEYKKRVELADKFKKRKKND